MEVPPPKSLLCPLKVPNKLLMGPGPSNCPPRVLQALSQPVIGHMHTEALQLMDDVKEGIQYAFQTRNELTLAVSASGHGGMEAIICNLVEPGDTVVVAVNGLWGERAANMAFRYGANVVILKAALGDNYTDAEFEAALQQHKPVLLFVVQGESCTGVYQPIENLGHLCHRYDCLLAVDTVASLGGVPLYADRWGVDAIYTGSQKVLGAPPGLAPISFSPRAAQRIYNRTTPIKVFYWDMTVLGDYWGCTGKPRMYHHTIPLTLLYGLREALAILSEVGLENSIRKHRNLAQYLYKGLADLGLQLYVQDPAKRLPTVTAIAVTEDLNWQDVLSYAMKNYNLEINGGLGPTVGKVMRIGLMGYNATEYNVDFTLRVLKEALNFSKSQKYSKL